MAAVGVPVTATSMSSKYSDELFPPDSTSTASSTSSMPSEMKQPRCVGGVNIQDLLKNKALGKLLVRAAAKVKQQQQRLQEQQLSAATVVITDC